ncbi:MAG TPA: TonB family protein, partial [Polyangia bacterium]
MTARSRHAVCAASGVALFLFAGPVVAAEAAEDATPAAPQLEAPRLTGFVEAQYPADIEPSTEAVEVELELVIAADGKVTEAKATTGSGSPFEAAAIEAARRFEFDPAKRDGKAIPARIRYRYVFASPAPPPPPAPTTGMLEGRVLASTEEPIADAAIGLSSDDGALARTLTTAADGTFRFDDLPAGSYRIEITRRELQSYASREEVSVG